MSVLATKDSFQKIFVKFQLRLKWKFTKPSTNPFSKWEFSVFKKLVYSYPWALCSILGLVERQRFQKLSFFFLWKLDPDHLLCTQKPPICFQGLFFSFLCTWYGSFLSQMYKKTVDVHKLRNIKSVKNWVITLWKWRSEGSNKYDYNYKVLELQ